MSRELRIPSRQEVAADDPLLLDVAARIAFPDGSVSGLALRNAARRGEIKVERLGGRLYTTLAWIGEWRTTCRLKPKGHASGSSAAISEPTESGAPAPGPSKTTPESVSARASAEHVLADLHRKLKTPSRSTSSRGASFPATSTVLPMPSRLRT